MPAKPDEQLPVSQAARELLPCPFCGGDAKRHTLSATDGLENAGGDVICCSRCGASSHVEFGRKENLVSRWNTRIEALTRSGEREPAPSTSEINALKDALAQANAEIAELRDEAVPEPAPSSERELLAEYDRRLVQWFKGKAAGFRAAAVRQGKRVGPLAKAYDYSASAILAGEHHSVFQEFATTQEPALDLHTLEEAAKVNEQWADERQAEYDQLEKKQTVFANEALVRINILRRAATAIRALKGGEQ